MSSALSIMNQLKADVLLEGSFILEQIQDLKKGLQYKTDGKFVSFDDHFLTLQASIDSIKRIQLEDSIPAQQGGRYENELLTALEEVQDQVERWTIKVIRFQGDLMRAKSDVDELSSAFESWYHLAAAELLDGAKISLPVKNIKALAASEFNRLMERSNLSIDALVEAVKIELKRLDSKQKMAKQKFEMGRQQVNAAWTNKLPELLGVSSEAPKFNLLHSGVVEDEEEPVTAFVSKSGVVKTSVQRDEVFGLPILSTFCSVCGEPQLMSPAGETCKNGHGGAPPMDTNDTVSKEAAQAHLSALAEAEHRYINSDLPVVNIKGTFVKHGDPVEVTVIPEVVTGDVVMEPEELHVTSGEDKTVMVPITIEDNGEIKAVEVEVKEADAAALGIPKVLCDATVAEDEAFVAPTLDYSTVMPVGESLTNPCDEVILPAAKARKTFEFDDELEAPARVTPEPKVETPAPAALVAEAPVATEGTKRKPLVFEDEDDYPTPVAAVPAAEPVPDTAVPTPVEEASAPTTKRKVPMKFDFDDEI